LNRLQIHRVAKQEHRRRLPPCDPPRQLCPTARMRRGKRSLELSFSLEHTSH
jgi:hypothetical protein